VENLNQYIDHTLLKVDSTKLQIVRLCEEAIQYNFFAVCVPPHYIKTAYKEIKNSTVKLATVIGFPLGYQTYKVKQYEIGQLAAHGLNEVDVVTNIVAVKNKNWDYLKAEWNAIINTSKKYHLTIKIIIESGLLQQTELGEICEIANALRPDFVKTSTGFNGTGAELTKVAFLKTHLDRKIQIKASGGIRDTEQALAFIDAGATRLGTSSGLKIIGTPTKHNHK